MCFSNTKYVTQENGLLWCVYIWSDNKFKIN